MHTTQIKTQVMEFLEEEVSWVIRREVRRETGQHQLPSGVNTDNAAHSAPKSKAEANSRSCWRRRERGFVLVSLLRPKRTQAPALAALLPLAWCSRALKF